MRYLCEAVVLQQPVDAVVSVSRLAHHDVPGGDDEEVLVLHQALQVVVLGLVPVGDEGSVSCVYLAAM